MSMDFYQLSFRTASRLGRYRAPAFSLLLGALCAGLLVGCAKSDAYKPAANAPDKAEAKAKPGLTLETEVQERLGLKLASPTPAEWRPELKVYGQVLDAAPLVDLVMELNRDEIALDSSRQELERAKKLQVSENISGRAYLDAQTAYAQNLAAANAVHFKIQTGWGRKLAALSGSLELAPGAQREPDQLLDALRQGLVLIRADLPAGERLENQSQSARIVPLPETTAPVTAVCFDILPAIDAPSQQQGVLFRADPPASSRLTPGEAVTAFIHLPGEAVRGVMVPASAILRYQGAAWIYVQTDTNQFVRTSFPLDRELEGGWFVAGALSSTNPVVVRGAQAVLSAELSGNGFSTGQRD